jgi:alpha-ketoglutarate-dependent taurine dioxygenase
MIAKKYNNISLSKLDPIEISKEVGTHGIVVIENSSTTVNEYTEWIKEFGYYNVVNIWCSDDIFWRVTNLIVDGENKGLFADDELDWHSNLIPMLDAEEVVGLYAKTITYNTETWICNSIPYYKSLDTNTQELFNKLVLHLGKGYHSNWQADFDIKYEPVVINDLTKSRNSRNIRESTNIEAKHKHLFKGPRQTLKKVKFVPNHSMGTKGIFFPPYQINGFSINGEEIKNGKDIFEQVWKDMIVTEKFTYKHIWKENDIILMDQHLTIHRREDVDKQLTRELLRSQSWYKYNTRNHTDYVL